jgi:hypothetical protein
VIVILVIGVRSIYLCCGSRVVNPNGGCIRKNAAEFDTREKTGGILAGPHPSGVKEKPLLSYLRPCKSRCCPTSLPEFGKVERPPGGLCEFENDFSRVLGKLRSNVNDFPPESPSAGADLYDRRAHVLFEGLVEKESNGHRLVEGSVLGKAPVGEPFRPKVFQRRVDHFIATPFMKEEGKTLQQGETLPPTTVFCQPATSLMLRFD